MFERFQLRHQTAIVTGGTRGIGRAIAIALLEAGASVIIVGRDEKRAQSVAAELQNQTGQICRPCACDLTKLDAASEVVESSVAEFGRLDILVNNAGVACRGSIESIPASEFLELLVENVVTMYNLSRFAVRHMKLRNYGRVINIGSILSTVGMPERAQYSASKGAVLQLTKSLALEWAPFGITVNCLLPGPILTDLNREFFLDPAVERSFLNRIPLARFGSPDEVAAAALFLAGPWAGYITGASMAIDGGWTAQ